MITDADKSDGFPVRETAKHVKAFTDWWRKEDRGDVIYPPRGHRIPRDETLTVSDLYGVSVGVLVATADVVDLRHEIINLKAVIGMLGVTDIEDAVSMMREGCDECSAQRGQLCERTCNCLCCLNNTVPSRRD